MSFFTPSTTERTLTVTEVHRCSSCKKRNATKQELTLELVDDAAFSRRSPQYLKVAAERRLDEIEAELKERLRDPDDVKKYSELNLCGRCESCGHQEPWAIKKYPILTTIQNVLLVMTTLSIIFAVVLLFRGSFTWLIPAVVLPTVTAGLFLSRWLYRRSREKKLGSLDKDLLPLLATSDEELITLLEEAGIDDLDLKAIKALPPNPKNKIRYY